MDLESIRRCWREDDVSPLPSLQEATVLHMLTNRTVDLRRQVRRRLRREAGYYAPLVAVSAASLVGEFTVNRMLAVCTVAILLGGVMATLWWAGRRIDDVALDRSLREALTDLGLKLDAAGRAYLAVYVAFFVVSSAILLGVIWRRHGVGLPLAGVFAMAALAVMWSVRSGRAYVERTFRRDRVDLSECLRQLEERIYPPPLVDAAAVSNRRTVARR
jgi:hypothetical protein